MTALMPMLLVLLLQSTALLLLGLLALRLTQKRGPAVQTLVGRASLASVALLLLFAPLTGHVQPVMRVALTPQQQWLPAGAATLPEPTPPRAATLPEREGEEVQRAGASPAPALRPPLLGRTPAK